ncbi:FYVE zinc finger-domain-containing protein [Syncephalis fuscata]|nr:FYVE zinc finger-domain-containing protein [Syncephalis fuscata]
MANNSNNSNLADSNTSSPVLACPICGQIAETLMALNNHLDVAHPETPFNSSTKSPGKVTATVQSTASTTRRPPILPPRQSGPSHRKSLSGSALLNRGNQSTGASSWLWGSVNGDDDREVSPFLEDEVDDDEDDEDFDPAQAVMGWFKQAQKKFEPAKNKLTQLAARAINSANTGGQQQARQSDGSLLSHLYSLSDPPQLALQQQIQSGDVIDQDEENWIMRAHWQPVTDGATCNAPGCAKQRGALTMLTGKEHCRSCGKLFCHIHCMCALKLNEKARHDPKRGRWCRVCEACFNVYQGAHDRQACYTIGLIRSKTATFLVMRQEMSVRTNLEANRLEKRLEKLAQAYADPSSVVGAVMQRIKPQQQVRKTIDQTIVTWEDDAAVDHCPLCGDVFKALVNRKHHCRLCGRVVCGQSHCSDVHTLTANGDLDGPVDDPFSVGEIRLCIECNRTVIRRREKRLGQGRPARLMDLYESLLVHRSTIHDLLPQFNQLAQLLKQEENTARQPYHDFQKASQIRKQLMDSFAQYDLVSKQIARLPTNTETEMRLQAAIGRACQLFLQQNMLSLSLLPKLLRPASTVSLSSLSSQTPDIATKVSPSTSIASSSKAATADESLRTSHGEKGPAKSSPPNSTPSPTGTFDKPTAVTLRETLHVLREQRERVAAYLLEANEHRKFEDVSTLQTSLDELELEITRIHNQLRDI